jgi:hypothetical protein
MCLERNSKKKQLQSLQRLAKTEVTLYAFVTSQPERGWRKVSCHSPVMCIVLTVMHLVEGLLCLRIYQEELA